LEHLAISGFILDSRRFYSQILPGFYFNAIVSVPLHDVNALVQKTGAFDFPQTTSRVNDRRRSGEI